MTIIKSEHGGALLGPLKTIDITLPFFEDSIDLNKVPSHFTSSIPTTPMTISYTIKESDLPVFSDSRMTSKYSPIIYLSGKNTTASTIAVTSQAKKNGVNMGLTSTVNTVTNCYWTQNYYRFLDTVVGDVISIDISAALGGVTLDYTGLFMSPTRMVLPEMQAYPNQQVLYRDLNFYTNTVTGPTLSISTGGTHGVSNTQGMNIYVHNMINTNGTIAHPLNNSAIQILFGRHQFPIAALTPEYGFGRMVSGDTSTNSTGGQGNTVGVRNWQRQAHVDRITYRELLK